jgi:predicted alpha/beta-fold hydrolase
MVRRTLSQYGSKIALTASIVVVAMDSANDFTWSRGCLTELGLIPPSLSTTSCYPALSPKLANEVVHSFQARSFNPADGWLGLQKNNHWQTIVGTGSLWKAISGKDIDRKFSVSQERFSTPDGDFFDVEYTSPHFNSEDDEQRQRNTAPMVVILHGLEANSKGTMVTKMTEAYLAKGFACVLVSFRGCSGEPNRTPGGYHVGFTKDVDQLTRTLQQRWPKRKIYLSGFSLGGNVSLKFLGELGDDTSKKRNIFGAVTMSVPYDTVLSSGSIDAGVNRYIYAANFLSTLKKKAEAQHALFPAAFPIERVRASASIGDFDDAYIATIYNFKDKNDYYIQNGSKAFLPQIRVPVISINAVDDPFIPEHSLPHPVDDVGGAPVRLIYHEHGGHCGFVAKRQQSAHDYQQVKNDVPVAPTAADAVVATASATSAAALSKEGGAEDDRWIAEEMARAMHHIHAESERRLLLSASE